MRQQYQATEDIDGPAAGRGGVPAAGRGGVTVGVGGGVAMTGGARSAVALAFCLPFFAFARLPVVLMFGPRLFPASARTLRFLVCPSAAEKTKESGAEACAVGL